MAENLSLNLAKKFLGAEVEVVVDRPLGSRHPQHDLVYQSNYGYVPGTKAPDGEELDAYYLGVSGPIARARGKCIAVIHRLDDNDDKLVVVPPGMEISNEEIWLQTNYQEKFFQSEIIRQLK